MNAKPWTKAELKLLGTDLDSRIADRIGRSYLSVYGKRRALGIASFFRFAWKARHVKQLGTKSDAVLARAWGISRQAVIKKRKALGIDCACPQNRPSKSAR